MSHKNRVEKLERSTPARNTRIAYDLSLLGEYLSLDELALIEQATGIMEDAERQYEADYPQAPGQEQWRAPSMRELFSYMSDEDLGILGQAVETAERAARDQKADTQQANGNGKAFNVQLTIPHNQKTKGRPWKN